MNTLQQWVAGVCCAAVACTVLELLHPEGAMRKPARYMVLLFFLGALILPRGGSSADGLRWPETDTAAVSGVTETVEELLRQQTIRLAETRIAQTVRDIAASVGVTPAALEVTIETDPQGVYTLRQVRLTLAADDRMYEATLLRRLEVQLQQTPEIVYTS